MRNILFLLDFSKLILLRRIYTRINLRVEIFFSGEEKMNKMTDAFLWRNIVGTPGLIYIFEFKQDGAV
ncbi:MAG: hypothetical protein BHV76_04520 [Phocaeicola plebeius]|uniref:Uncharacterized protein n=1 Tax=Phocaeicola plebeius TaxID=310297 RepID=A0A854C2D5_9BACT|nr:MAG: hypothetical protein BHV76_04520 [Phocaeicola plebeius]